MSAIVRTTSTTVVTALLAVVLYLGVVAAGNGFVGGRASTGKVDAIVVMGAAQYDGVPSPMLEGRLRAALALWSDGAAPLIAVTGGKQEGDRFTEAASSRRWLLDHGVDADVIVAEESGRSTWESLALLAPVLHGRGVGSIVVVTDGWHLPRSVLTARELGFAAAGSPVRTSLFAWSGGSSLKEALGVALGRLVGFEHLWEVTG